MVIPNLLLAQQTAITTPYSSDAAIIPAIIAEYSETQPSPEKIVKPTKTTLKNLHNIDFRRTAEGGAKIILSLPSAQTAVKLQNIGTNLQIQVDAKLIQATKERINLLDFATAVTFLEVQIKDHKTYITLYTQAEMNPSQQRHGNEYTINLAIQKTSKTSKAVNRTKKFTGDKLSLSFHDIEVRSVLQILADFTKKNIAVSDSVTGNITLSLKDIPWDQALDIILKTKNLSLRENNQVLWIAPSKEMIEKEQQALEAEQRKQALKPLITATIAINFAQAKDLAALLKESKGNSLLSERGSVSLDERTNTLLIQDIASQVSQIKKLIKTLDVPVKQVLIESRIVVANSDFSKDLGTKFGVSSVLSQKNNLLAMSGSNAATATMIQSANSNLLNTGDLNQVNIPDSTERLSVNLPTIGAAGTLGFAILSKGFLLDLELSALQAESKGEIIATPRVITLNQHPARIEQGIEIPYQQVTKSGATSIAFKKAVLSMDVTPQITPNGHIVIDLKVHQDTVGQIFNNVPSINTRAVQTKVLVENGQTIVLGGVHEESNLYADSKVPVLGDIPVLGRLFKKTHQQDTKRELLIFLTPKIISRF
jgi:type IV pilus assembly protein PilQ